MAFQFNDTGRFREACPSRETEQPHCWHHNGLTYTSNPSQHDETCCYCGRVDRIIDPPAMIAGSTHYFGTHGPHVAHRLYNQFVITGSSGGGSSSSQPGEPAK